MTTFLRHLSGIFNGMAIRIDKLCYGKMGEKEFKSTYPANYELLMQNSEFENLHKGKRCFIVGNGPSLNKQDLSLLAQEFVFTVNYIYNNEQFKSMKTNYHFFMDHICFNVDTHPPEKFEAINTDGNSPICFCPINGGYEYAQATSLDKKLKLRYLFDFVPFEKPIDIRTDLTKGITGLYTVVQTAILAAIYMGFSEIYLLGCDCTGIVTNINVLERSEKVEGYSYTFSENDREKLLNEYKNRIKITDTFSSWTKTFMGYERILQLCNSKGIKLYNATHGGILDSLPRVNYTTLFKDKCK